MKKRDIFLIFMIFFIILSATLVLIYLYYFSNDFYNNLASIIGGSIGGVTTLIAVLITTRQTRKIQETNKNHEWKKHQIEIRFNLVKEFYDMLLTINKTLGFLFSNLISNEDYQHTNQNEIFIENKIYLNKKEAIKLMNDCEVYYGKIRPFLNNETHKEFLNLENDFDSFVKITENINKETKTISRRKINQLLQQNEKVLEQIIILRNLIISHYFSPVLYYKDTEIENIKKREEEECFTKGGYKKFKNI